MLLRKSMTDTKAEIEENSQRKKTEEDNGKLNPAKEDTINNHFSNQRKEETRNNCKMLHILPPTTKPHRQSNNGSHTNTSINNSTIGSSIFTFQRKPSNTQFPNATIATNRSLHLHTNLPFSHEKNDSIVCTGSCTATSVPKSPTEERVLHNDGKVRKQSCSISTNLIPEKKMDSSDNNIFCHRRTNKHETKTETSSQIINAGSKQTRTSTSYMDTSSTLTYVGEVVCKESTVTAVEQPPPIPYTDIKCATENSNQMSSTESVLSDATVYSSHHCRTENSENSSQQYGNNMIEQTSNNIGSTGSTQTCRSVPAVGLTQTSSESDANKCAETEKHGQEKQIPVLPLHQMNSIRTTTNLVCSNTKEGRRYDINPSNNSEASTFRPEKGKQSIKQVIHTSSMKDHSHTSQNDSDEKMKTTIVPEYTSNTVGCEKAIHGFVIKPQNANVQEESTLSTNAIESTNATHRDDSARSSMEGLRNETAASPSAEANHSLTTTAPNKALQADSHNDNSDKSTSSSDGKNPLQEQDCISKTSHSPLSASVVPSAAAPNTAFLQCSSLSTPTKGTVPASTNSASSNKTSSSFTSTGRWTREEHEAFLAGLKIYGREWKKVAQRIPTRTSAQIRSHAQKYFAKLGRTSATANAVDEQPSYELADLPFSVQQNVQRILANPTQVQKQVEETLARLHERYRQLQKQMEMQSQTKSNQYNNSQPSIFLQRPPIQTYPVNTALPPPTTLPKIVVVTDQQQPPQPHKSYDNSKELIALQVLRSGLRHTEANNNSSTTIENDTHPLTPNKLANPTIHQRNDMNQSIITYSPGNAFGNPSSTVSNVNQTNPFNHRQPPKPTPSSLSSSSSATQILTHRPLFSQKCILDPNRDAQELQDGSMPRKKRRLS